jgi:hypothetical protein
MEARLGYIVRQKERKGRKEGSKEGRESEFKSAPKPS